MDNISRVDFTQEIRFAVVMYGGSSLAVYMNGVAQELLRMVRATAPLRKAEGGSHEEAYRREEELEGTERVYRELGQRLRRASGPREDELEKDAQIRTRFVVDILTGASAGGINAIYLAKALTNNQDLSDLMNLWVSKGDIAILLNRPPSYRIDAGGNGEELNRSREQPASPLNSARMYWELLDAFRGMDNQKRDDEREPNCTEELDLYVTATDPRGRIVNMRLTDKVVQEMRYKNVFHFSYRHHEGRAEHSDFTSKHNPFLAFVARCTSAHQAAFEVMSLKGIKETIKDAGGLRSGELDYDHEDLRKFYDEYLLAGGNIEPERKEGGAHNGTPSREELAEDFQGRFFNDGGTLDNSPFSFVSDILPFRETQYPVDRKLLYVEPSPEDAREKDRGNRAWGFVENAVAGLSTLPSQQTIVEDLKRLQERNRLIERVSHILANIKDDIKARNKGVWPQRYTREQMYNKNLADLIGKHGASWGGYQHLRIAQVTNDLTQLIARASGIDEESDEFYAVRELVRLWRRSLYEDKERAEKETELTPDGEKLEKQPEINFLLDFDLSWTIRRVQFVLRQINELDCLDKAAEKTARVAEQEDMKITWPEGDDERKEFRSELHKVRRRLNEVYARLRKARRRFWARRGEVGWGSKEQGQSSWLNPFQDSVDALKIPKAMLRGFHRIPTEKMRSEQIGNYLHEPKRKKAFEDLAKKVREEIGAVIDASREKCGEGILTDPWGTGQLSVSDSVKYILRFYYLYFEDFDQVSFPIFYSTDVGEETDEIEIFRVSPDDADSLVNERDDLGKAGKSKLAGTALAHFGAFFDEGYRRNDILWGRLDGAERIISALLPGDGNKSLRDYLVEKAHKAIITEKLTEVVVGLKQEDTELAGGIEKALGEGVRLSDEMRERLRASSVSPLWRSYLLISLEKNSEGRVKDFKKDFKAAFIESYDAERAFSRWRKIGLYRKGGYVLLKLLLKNIRQLARKLKAVRWLILVGPLIAIAGGATFAWGLYRTLTIPLRYAARLIRKIIAPVNEASKSRTG
ncbi:MAG: patatin-like protein [Rubrivivax sp.]|nr:patatin-like protein [Pyrinomonadaceae bacterium]